MRRKIMAEPMPPTPPVAPYLTVSDANAAIDFYQTAFGAVEVSRMPGPDGKKLIHAAMTINGGLVMMSDDIPEFNDGRSSTPESFGGSPVTIHLNVPDVDAAWDRAVQAGATVIMPLADQFWGDRYGQLRDPFGHNWSLSTPGTPRNPEEMARAMRQGMAGD
jgi:PhnB protein